MLFCKRQKSKFEDRLKKNIFIAYFTLTVTRQKSTKCFPSFSSDDFADFLDRSGTAPGLSRSSLRVAV